MPRARNKEDLLQFSEENYSKLLKMISAMSENQMSTEFDFSDDAGINSAHDSSLIFRVKLSTVRSSFGSPASAPPYISSGMRRAQRSVRSFFPR